MRPQSVQRDSWLGDPPPTWRSWQGEGLSYPWSHHLERVRGNPLCVGTWTHTQGHLGVEKEERCYRWLGCRWGQRAYTHLRTSCRPAFRFCSQLPAYHSPGGSSPRGGVRLEPFSLRAEPGGRDGSSWGWVKLFHRAQDSREQLFPVSLGGGGRDRDEPPGKGYSVHV